MPAEFRAPAETILGLYHELALACRKHRVFTPDCPEGERSQRLLLAAGEVAERLGVAIEAAPHPPGAEGPAVRRIDLRPRGVRGFIRAAFHADDPVRRRGTLGQALRLPGTYELADGWLHVRRG